MKKINKTELKIKILQVLEIAPSIHEKPIEVWRAINPQVKQGEDQKYPLKAVRICIEEIQKEQEEEFEWDE